MSNMPWPVIKGSGFKNGGFRSVTIDGKEYQASQIAAFPDLLAALDVCAELLAHDVRLNVAGPREIAALKQAREAYAKATGGS